MFRSCHANLTSKAYRGGEYSCGRSIPLRAMVVAFAGSLLICSTVWADPQPDGPAKGPNQDYPGAISLGIWVADSPGTGVLVVDVAEESPAAIAGIRAGDFILSVDDNPVEKPRNLQRALRSRRGGDHVSIELWRNGKTESVDAELAAAAGEQAVQDRAWLGVALKGAGADDEQPTRPVIIQVFAGSPAEQAELKVGDRVVAVDDQAIKSTTQLLNVLGKMKPGQTIQLTVRRGGEEVVSKIELESMAAALPLVTPRHAGPTVPPPSMLEPDLLPMVPFGHVMRGYRMEELPERLDETDRQLQELRERLKVLIERFDRESLDGDRETVDPDDGDSATSPQREAKDVPLLEHLPRKTANPVLAAPDDRERRDSDRRYQPEDRRVPRNRYRYYYYRAPYANLSVYPGFYVPWYSFPSNSPYIYNWPPQRPYYYYRYRGRSFYVRPRPLPYRYGPGNTVVVPPDSEDTYYQ